jgi:hypothetical protein
MPFSCGGSVRPINSAWAEDWLSWAAYLAQPEIEEFALEEAA